MNVNAHRLTLKFHRFLSEREWYEVMMIVRTVPHVAETEATAVQETADELERARPATTRPSS